MRKSRNEVIFEGSERGAEQICRYGQDLPHEYQSLHTKQEAPICYQELGNSNPDNKWKPPPENYMKMNVDAAFKDEEAGIGVIIRDRRGELEAMMLENISSCYGAEQAETIAILKALEFAKDFELTHFVIEGDALSVINKIYSGKTDLNRRHQDHDERFPRIEDCSYQKML